MPGPTIAGGHPLRQSYHHRNKRVIIPEGVMAVGLIVGAHGLRGEVKVEVHTDFPQRFTAGNSVLIGTELSKAEIVAARPHKAFYLLRFKGMANRADAESLRGQWLFIREEDAAPLGEDTYWIHDIIGMTVIEASGRILGTVRNVLETGANEVYLIDPAEGVNLGRQVLLPAISEVVKEVDLDNRVITVDLLPGLIDEQE